MEKETQENLIARLKARDKSAYTYLVANYYKYLAKIAQKYFSHAKDKISKPKEIDYELKDVIQEAFIKVLRNMDSFNGDERQLKIYLARTVTNICIDVLIRRPKARFEQSMEYCPEAANTTAMTKPPDWKISQEEKEDERKGKIDIVMLVFKEMALTSKEKRAIQLKFASIRKKGELTDKKILLLLSREFGSGVNIDKLIKKFYKECRKKWLLNELNSGT